MFRLITAFEHYIFDNKLKILFSRNFAESENFGLIFSVFGLNAGEKSEGRKVG